MISKIIEEISRFYNGKKVVFFNTDSFKERLTDKTKSFKLGEQRYGGLLYIIYARINEGPSHVEVIKLDIRTVENDMGSV